MLAGSLSLWVTAGVNCIKSECLLEQNEQFREEISQ